MEIGKPRGREDGGGVVGCGDIRDSRSVVETLKAAGSRAAETLTLPRNAARKCWESGSTGRGNVTQFHPIACLLPNFWFVQTLRLVTASAHEWYSISHCGSIVESSNILA